MNDPLLERLKGYGSDLDVATELAATRVSTDAPLARGRQHRLLPVMVGIVCGVVVVAALAATNSTGPRTGSTESMPTTTNTAAGQVTAHFEFTSNELVAGDTLDGWLVIDNDTGHDIDTRDDGCAPKWGASLTNAGVPPAAGFTWECLTDPAKSTITQGITRLPVAVSASYSECTRDPIASDSGMLACLPPPASSAPPLPAGEYQAVFVGNLPGVPTPAPVAITVVDRPTTTLTSTAAGQVTAHLEFTSTEVVAGEALEGWLVIDNNTGSAIDISQNGCAPKWAVRLTNASVPPSAMFTADCRIDPTTSTLPTGTTRLPVTATAVYAGCSGGPASASATTFLPACLADSDNRIPPLPAGEYEAVLVGDLPGIPTPAPVKITVLEPTAT
ncbi:MAG: hypothetical protein ABMA25_04810 [Ilumatobacteraceae bacterium]